MTEASARMPVHGPLHVESMGLDGAPLMAFVHPNPMDNASWMYQMGHMATWFRTAAVDLPGYGRSPTAASDVTMPEIAAACWEAFDRVSDQPAVVVGCSVGASVVKHMYHLRPDRVQAVVLSGTGYKPEKAFVPRRVAEFREYGLPYRRPFGLECFSPAFRDTPMATWFMDLFEERNGTADLDTIVAMFEAHGARDPEWLDLKLHVPTLILTGSEDNSHAAAFPLLDRLPDAELVTLEGAGHACHMEQPHVFDREMLAFLRRRGALSHP